MKFESQVKNTLIAFLIDFIDQNNVLPADERLLELLEKFWDIDHLSSDDQKFTEARGNIWQHMINNGDWTSRELFTSKLKLSNLNGEQIVSFIKEVFVFIPSEASDDFIHRLSLCLTDYFIIIKEENPVLQRSEIRLTEKQNFIDTPINIIENKIPIYKSESKIEIYPCFTLIYDKWDDYSNKTTFYLQYSPSKDEEIYLYKIKIMKVGVRNTLEVLDDIFYSLSDEYCSLGQSEQFYVTLFKILGIEMAYGFLYAIKDAAFFPKIHEKFSNDKIFNDSLIRNSEVERLCRTAKIKISGKDISEYYKFLYSYHPPYSEENIKIPFNFDPDSEKAIQNRVIALIGKNGAGKTQLLSQLVNDIHSKNWQKFNSQELIFSKIFTISYSIFDRFKIPAPNAEFNYVYCGLKKEENNFFSHREIEEMIKQSFNKLVKRSDLNNKWYKIFLSFIEKSQLDLIIKHKEIITGWSYDEIREENEIIAGGWEEFFKTLSSGQSIMLNVMSKLLSEIRYDSLILFDEPETHLHPNAISELISVIFDIVNQFESFCIISTHSPIIIQQMRAENVLILERDGDVCTVSSPSNDTFGENLTCITEDIFGNISIPKYFIEKIEELISLDLNLEEIKTELRSKDLNLSLNTELYINAFYTKHHEKP